MCCVVTRVIWRPCLDRSGLFASLSVSFSRDAIASSTWGCDAYRLEGMGSGRHHEISTEHCVRSGVTGVLLCTCPFRDLAVLYGLVFLGCFLFC